MSIVSDGRNAIVTRRSENVIEGHPPTTARSEADSVELGAGTIEYIDTGGDGPVLVFLHGLLMDASLWDGVIADLAPRYRCIAPTLPLGAHNQPMGPDADLSLPGIARLVGELLDRLDLDKVTVVGNDTGGALVQLLMYEGCSRRGSRARVL